MTKQQLEAQIKNLEQQAEQEYALRLSLVRQLEAERDYARQKSEEAEKHKLRASLSEARRKAYAVWLVVLLIDVLVLTVALSFSGG